ncbi:hypothetical protein HZA85_01455 [Candidatus Uhrbacteria bacterium]|nr:hypothetical protein [Candidatus Uhrbacteria bacterium]
MLDEAPKSEPMISIERLTEPSDNVHVQHFLQTAGLCGPASLKILLSYFAKTYSEEELAKLG